MDKSKKRHIAYEILILCIVIALLCFATRLWPILLLALVGAIIAALVLLFASASKSKTIILDPPPPAPAPPENERELERVAFAILERRITELVLGEHPQARWVWETPNPQKALLAGDPLGILLNRAGGFRRADVIVRNLQLVSIEYGSAADAQKPDAACPLEHAEPKADREDTAMPTNYSLMAFDWVEEHIGYLSDRCNDAIARGESQFVIPEDQLPTQDCWEAICRELAEHEFGDAATRSDGVVIETPQYED